MFKKKVSPANPDKWVEKVECVSDLFMGEEKSEIAAWLKENLPLIENIVIIADYRDDEGYHIITRKYAFPERSLWLLEKFKQAILEG